MNQITINEFKNIYIKNFLNNPDAPSVLLVSDAGIGKTTIIENIANENGYNIYTFRGAEHDSTDLIGMPKVINNKTIFVKPVWVPNKNERFIFFADELNRAKIDVRQVCFRIAEKRGTENWEFNKYNHKVILAINPENDMYQIEELDKAFLNRLAIFYIKPDKDSFIEWARTANIDERIINYINDNPESLYNIITKENISAYPTPRSWEYLSNIINKMYEIKDKDMPLISSVIGEAEAYEFIKYINREIDIKEIKSIKDLLKIKNNPPQINKLIKNIAIKINQSKNIDKKFIEDFFKYMDKDQIYLIISYLSPSRLHEINEIKSVKKQIDKLYNLI